MTEQARTPVGPDGKPLPRPRVLPWLVMHTVGRLACGSNDLLVDALGAGFADLDDAAAFLLWAHAQA